ncbi:alkene reductase [Streptomyces sp. NPDC092369]|uniref:alkene reductase n=1 Tax=Streptomyces sp. NPDC092369 TaxID=3366015 RepID=UPI0037FC9B25
MTSAFDPIELFGRTLPNRIVMAPMSRARADAVTGRVGASTALYYRQRASAGFIVSEAIFPSEAARGQPSAPGLYDDDQIGPWRAVTEAAHHEDGVIVGQLMHTGRIGHPANLADGLPPQAPSRVRADHQVVTPQGLQACVEPRAMTGREIEHTIDAYAKAARRMVEAGFDGLEIHAANGYLAHQFLSSHTNHREDRWGGTVSNRIRFVTELVEAVSEVFGARRVGVQISPGNDFNDMRDPEADLVYPALVTELNRADIAYLAVSEAPDNTLVAELRRQWAGPFLLNPRTGPRCTSEEDLAIVERGEADLISIGRMFIANPDLPRRLAQGGPFNALRPEGFYGGTDEGYVDYPALPLQPSSSGSVEQSAAQARSIDLR